MKKGASMVIWVLVALLVVLSVVLLVALLSGNLVPFAKERIDIIGQLGGSGG